MAIVFQSVYGASAPGTTTNLFPVGTSVFAVTSQFGVAMAQITAVTVTQTTINAVPAITYTIRYSNPSRNTAQIDYTQVFADEPTAITYYQTIIT